MTVAVVGFGRTRGLQSLSSGRRRTEKSICNGSARQDDVNDKGGGYLCLCEEVIYLVIAAGHLIYLNSRKEGMSHIMISTQMEVETATQYLTLHVSV